MGQQSSDYQDMTKRSRRLDIKEQRDFGESLHSACSEPYYYETAGVDPEGGGGGFLGLQHPQWIIQLIINTFIN